MTKTISAPLKDHYAQATTTLAKLLHIERTDGVEYFFTDHDQDITHAGDTYVAVGGFSATAVSTSTGTAVDNSEAEAIIHSSGLTEDAIIAGLLDFAEFTISEINYESVADGVVISQKGTIGEYSSGDISALLELRGLKQHLQQRVGRLLMKKCDADLGDARCKVALGPFTVTGTVLTVTDRQKFTVTTAPAAHGGLLTFTSGGNNGLSMEVRSISGSTINLSLPIPFDINIGDGYSAYRGCDKRDSICKSVFSNLVNFRGVPFLTGNDKLLTYPDQPKGGRAI